MKDELCYLSASDAIAQFKARTLSPVELTRAVIERAESIAASINPFADTYFEEALDHARHSETKYPRRGGRPRRLEGLPLAVKDSFAIKGRRSTTGSLFNAERIDERTDPSIERLLRSGANLFARTTCPELCWLYTCHTRMWGVTRNPWRLDVTPGGSSGGSAAALAAGAATIATGSDSTGSIRQPAAQCGVVGYQAPQGRIPVSAQASFDPYINAGPMARTVADAALMTNVMSGPHPLDHHSLPNRVTVPSTLAGIEGLKIAYSMDLGHYEMIDDVRRETSATLDTLRDAGAELVEVDFDASEAIRLAHAHEEFMLADIVAGVVRDHPELICDYTPELAETATSVTAQDYRNAIRVAGRFWRDHLGPMFSRFDALLCPTVSCPEVPAENWQKHKLVINGKSLTDTDTAMTALFNMYNRCPILAIPSGMTDAGLPSGVQIVGRPHDDVTVFRIGHAVETRRPWLDCASSRPDPRLWAK
ncbi:MAG: amidase [Gammaproteobacteria bacterium]